MTNTETTLREELLKQNGARHGRPADEDRKRLDEMIAKEQRHLRALRRGRRVLLVVVALWPFLAALFALVLSATPPLRSHPFAFVGTWLILMYAWSLPVILAVIATIRTYLFSRTVGMHQIQSTLGRIADQLERFCADARVSPPDGSPPRRATDGSQ